jgi:hypothetical protein
MQQGRCYGAAFFAHSRPKMNDLKIQPEIRILHHMARSGGTIISRCLGCMDGVYLLSEIHPRGLQFINPLHQADQWYGLLTGNDIADITQRGGIGFVPGIALINRRCQQRGGTLLIRDWSHLDFTGWPHLPDPTYRLTTAEILRNRFSVIHTSTVRHPIDQWLSFRESQNWTNSSMPLEDFLRGYRRFAEQSAAIGFVRYEDFTRDPTQALRTICYLLRITYDDDFRNNWSSYVKITTAPGKRDGGFVIRQRVRPSVGAELLEQFDDNEDYHHAISILGYKHPQ